MPLVGIDRARPDRVVCPIPFYLLRRTSTGVFYDLIKSPNFDNAFGDSFQVYVGEVIEFACKPPRFSVLLEEPYYIGSNKFHGVDWVVSDDTGHLFIEAKTKRLTLGAKILSAGGPLERDLITMATAIFQHYRNIRRALDGKTRWQLDGLPIYPMILTLEDWFIFSPRITEILKNHVVRLLGEHGIPDQVLSDMPYTIASVHEFEVAVQIVSQVGIHRLMGEKTSVEERNWSLLPLIRDRFSEEMKRVNWAIFEKDWKELLPEPSR